VTITWQSTGYRLTVDEQAVDVHRFRDLTRRTRDTECDDDAIALAERALSLWRGEPFGALDHPWFTAQRASLARQRHATRLDLTDRRLRRGDHAALLADLADEAATHAWDERIAGQLMLALHRSGRPSEALQTYQHIRRRLADELGTDPCAALQELHQRILTADPALATTSVGTPQTTTTATVVTPPVTHPVVPRQLPAPPAPFVGRRAELDHLTTTLLTGGPGSAANPAVCVVSGVGGVGKTWLALHWAHHNAERFPDGQLHVNLRGFDPSGEPLTPQAVLHGFLTALGVDADAVPTDLDARTGLYRSLLADRRMLVVADNAADTTQVTPLLPAGPSCAVLVTSRNRLPGLATAHGAHLVSLDVMSECEARALQLRHLDGLRLGTEPAAAADLLSVCAGLPLALSITAARAAQHPTFPLAGLAGELRETHHRLDALDAGDPHANLRTVLSWSCHALDPRARRVFALLGLAEGPDVGLPAAAALTGLTVGQTRGVLRTLENASLVRQHAPGRYRMHDLVGLHAAEQAEQQLTTDARTSAARRLVDFYLHTASAADHLMYPHREVVRLDPPSDGHRPQPLADTAAALRWFDTERACLAATVELARARRWHTAVWQLARLVETFLYLHHRTPERTSHRRVEQVADPDVTIIRQRTA
jgi:hypothetical protein